jgi:GNAT superfamily N-acetyltransferase
MEQKITIRKALRSDVRAIVKLFSEDILGSKRENYTAGISQKYYDAFETISLDNTQVLVVAEIDGKVIGTLQISYVTNMSFEGSVRAMIEGVHVNQELRSQGIGKYLMEWAILQAKNQGCRFVQLTSNKQRQDAHRFYERLGFAKSHEGFKLDLGK